MKAGTNLEKVLEGGMFAVTAEAGPPRGAVPSVIRRKGELLGPFCDALNITDNQTSIVRMSSLSGCVLLKELGVDPVMQIVCRDRNRIAIQSDVLGAVALGIGNVLCLTGDYQSFGDHASAKSVFDLDSIQLIQMLRQMREEKKFLSGESITGEVNLFIGAAENPFADPFEYRVPRLAKKVKSGVDFIQTQAIFDIDKFSKWMEMVTDRGLDKECHILAGIIPIRTVGMVRYMRDKVPGVDVPDSIVTRMEDAKESKEEGLKICLETIEQIKEVPGIHGVHIMAVGWEDIVPTIVEKAGLLPRPLM